MDRGAAYTAAHKHASSGQYREAQGILAQIVRDEPSNVAALILLGKVEYYLGHASRSRRCFQTALIYDPANIAAFFGLEHYRARRRAAWYVGCALLLAAPAAGAAFTAARWSTSVLLDAGRQVSGTINELSRSVQELRREVGQVAEAVAAVQQSVHEEAGDSRGRLREVSLELARIRGETEALRRGLQELRQAVDTQRVENGAH